MSDLPAVVDLGPAASGTGFHPLCDRLREERPVCRGLLPDGSLVWLVTRHDDVRAALTDPRLSLSKSNAKGWKGFGLPPVLDANLLNMDAPQHTRIRRLVAHAFRQAAVERLRPRVAHLAARLLADIRPRGHADLVASFIDPLTMGVVCEFLGVPAEDRMDLRTWNEAMLSGSPDAQAAQDKVVDLLTGLIRRKRAAPGDDLVSDLVLARDDGDRLDEDELTSLVFLVLVAGHLSAANFLGNAVLATWRHPELAAALRTGPGPASAVVEELLRLETSEAVAPRRFPVADLEIGGVAIKAGEPVVLVLSAANRDPRHHPDPGSPVLHRTGRNLSFGLGAHYCLGAGLARLESEVAIEAVVRALPGLRPTVPEADLAWLPTFRFRGLTALPVTWDLAAPAHTDPSAEGRS